MEWVNVTAKSLPEAIDLALDNLGVDEAEAEIEVLEEPKQGLFGRTRGNARVKARVKPKATRPKVDRNKNRRRRGEGGGSGKGSGGNRNRSDGKRRDGGQDSKARGEKREGAGKASSSTGGGGGGGSKSGGGSNRNGRPKKQRQDQAPVKEVPVEEVSAHIESFLTGLAEAFGVEGAVHVDSDGEEGLVGKVDGQHGLMVGPKGRTLDAIQELTRVTAQRSTPSSVRIKVDVGGYREMRKAALQKFAVGVAEAAVADGKERALEPMSSADRKIVHDALNELGGIETRSAGNEPRRRVVVVPVDGGSTDDESVEDEIVDEPTDTEDAVVAESDAPAESGADDESETVVE